MEREQTVIASWLVHVPQHGAELVDDRPQSRRGKTTEHHEITNGDISWSTLAEMYTKLTLDARDRDPSMAMTTKAGTSADTRRPRRRTVQVRVAFLKIDLINTRKQVYDADVFVSAKWEEPRLAGRSAENLEDFCIDSYWTPELYITNVFGTPNRNETWYEVQNGEKCPVVLLKMRVRGTFRERLELEDFPFDVQELQLNVASRLTERSVHLVADETRVSTVNRHNAVDQNEWSLHDHVDTIRCVIRNKASTDAHHHPCISFMCSARRNPTFYCWNIFFIMLVQTSLIFCTVGIPAINYEERLKINIILLLTVVAMKYVATAFYPIDLAYLTYMDIYNILCVLLVAIMSIQNAILSFFTYDAVLLTNVDNGTIYFIVVLYLVIQVAAIIFAIVVICRSRYNLRQRDKEYNAEVRRRRITATDNSTWKTAVMREQSFKMADVKNGGGEEAGKPPKRRKPPKMDVPPSSVDDGNDLSGL